MTRRRTAALASLLALAIAVLPSAAGAAAGDLDPSFGTGGKVTTDFGEGDQALGIVLQPNGKIVAAGFSFAATSSDFVLARYRTDGSLDPTFDGDGRVTTDMGGYDFANAVAFRPGQLVAVGGTGCCPNNRIAVARYRLDGSLDPTFDEDGKATVGLTTQGAWGNDVVVQPDGKIVVAAPVDFNPDFAVVRFNHDGSLDSTFDGDGWARTDFGLQDSPAAIAIQSDGRIILAGGTEDDAASDPESDFALARYNPDGSLDQTFDGDGKVTIDLGSRDIASDLAIQADGKIVVAGTTSQSSSADFALVRLNTDGSLDMQGLDPYLDAPFGTGGKVVTDFATGDDEATSVGIEPGGKIVVAGIAGTSGNADFDFGLIRFHIDGSLDSSFGTGGKVMTSFTPEYDFAIDVAIQRDGRIVLAGDAGDNTNSRDFAVARYLVRSCCSIEGFPPGSGTETGPAVGTRTPLRSTYR